MAPEIDTGVPANAEEYNDDTPMPFGKYKGKPLKYVPANYLDWCIGQEWLPKRWPQLAAYITKNWKYIEKELDDMEAEREDSYYNHHGRGDL